MWATEFSKKRNKVQIYNRGFIAILQRLLTQMSEESAFWVLIGLAKSMKKVFSIDVVQVHSLVDDAYSKYEAYNSFTNRKICFKNEMIIISCLIKLHYPDVFSHLKSLAMPIEWYFYDSLTQFFSDVFPSNVVFRLWDMIVLNLSTTDQDHRKRALWYLLAVPIYLISKHNDEIVRIQDPVLIKELLLKSTPVYDPLVFVKDLL